MVAWHGDLLPAWRAALGKVSSLVTRASFKRDRPTFEVACQGREELTASYARWATAEVSAAGAHSLVYLRTEVMALRYSGAKSLLRR